MSEIAYAFGGEPGKRPFETHEMRALRDLADKLRGKLFAAGEVEIKLRGELRQANERADELRDRWLQCERERIAAVEALEKAHRRNAAHDGLGARLMQERCEAIKERDEWRGLSLLGRRGGLLEKAEKERDEARHARAQAEQALADIQAGYRSLLAERDSAIEGERHAKAQMEIRWQAAEKECERLRAQLAAKQIGFPFEEAIRACQATHPGVAWCEKCR